MKSRKRKLAVPAVLTVLLVAAYLVAFIGPQTWFTPFGEGGRRVPQLAQDLVAAAEKRLPGREPPPPPAKKGKKGAKKAPPPKRPPPPADCSSFTQAVFAEKGLRLPRTAAEQSELGSRVFRLLPGDLLFFSGARRSLRVGHVAIYAGKGRFIHVPNAETGVVVNDLDDREWRVRFLFARRVLE